MSDIDPDIDDVEGHEERVEWVVETDQTVDFFGADEAAARDWSARCADDPEWLPVRLLRRTVVTETSKWQVEA